MHVIWQHFLPEEGTGVLRAGVGGGGTLVRWWYVEAELSCLFTCLSGCFRSQELGVAKGFLHRPRTRKYPTGIVGESGIPMWAPDPKSMGLPAVGGVDAEAGERRGCLG